MSKPRQPKSRSSKSQRNPRRDRGGDAPRSRELRVGSAGLIALAGTLPGRMVPAWVEVLERTGDTVRVGIVARRIRDDGSLGFTHVAEGYIEERTVSVAEVLPISGREIRDARVGCLDQFIDLRLGRAFDLRDGRYVVADYTDCIPTEARRLAGFLMGFSLFR